MIIFEGQNKNYKEYETTILSIISMIKEKNVSLVGVLCERTPMLLYLIKSLFDYGIAFVTIDSQLPIERMNYIIKDSNLSCIITQKKFDEILSGVNKIYIDEDYTFSSLEVECCHDNDIAYVLYTSGSTGNPKGVEVTREGLFNFFEGMAEVIEFSAGKRIACFTTVSFDIFLLESLFALHRGLVVVLANEKEQSNPKLMADLIKNNYIDMIQMTPSRMQLLYNYDKELRCFEFVKDIMIGGEKFPIHLLHTLQMKTRANIYNMYGPTETTIWSTVSNLTKKKEVNIGLPILNTQIYILDEMLVTVPDGEIGEICIAGKGLAKGYINKKELTNEKFVYLQDKTNIRVYRTGDLGKVLPTGELEYVGRLDNQVKIRGYRIELEEIETCINRCDGIEQSVVVASQYGESFVLEAYYTSKKGVEVDDLREFLSKFLPEYMIPHIYKQVSHFFFTTSGKIDRARIKECPEETSKDKGNNNEEMVNMDVYYFIREAIMSRLDEVLLENISLDSSLVALGLDSITFVNLVISLEEEYNFEFEEEKLLLSEFSTIRDIVIYVEKHSQT